MWLFGKPNVDKLKAKKNVRALIKALTHDEKHIRRNAAIALGEINDSEATQSLKAALRDREPDVRLAAKEALEQFNWSPQTDKEQALFAFASGDASDSVLMALMPKVYINYGRLDWIGSSGFTLPDGVKVFEKEETDYIINLTWNEATVGQYTGGQKAIQKSCIVEIIKCETSKQVATRMFSGNPPQKIPGSHSAGLGSPTFSEINEYVVQWYNSIDKIVSVK